MLGESAGGDLASVTFPVNVSAGDLIVAIGTTWQSPTPGAPVVSDNLSTPTSYTVLSGLGWDNNNFRVFVAYGIAAVSGACTLTVNPPTSSVFLTFGADFFHGAPASSPLDVDGGITRGASTNPTANITTTAANALIVGWYDNGLGTGAATAPGAGYTQICEVETNGNRLQGIAEFQIVTSIGTYAVNASAPSGQWAINRVSFKPDVAPPAPGGRPGMFHPHLIGKAWF